MRLVLVARGERRRREGEKGERERGNEEGKVEREGGRETGEMEGGKGGEGGREAGRETHRTHRQCWRAVKELSRMRLCERSRLTSDLLLSTAMPSRAAVARHATVSYAHVSMVQFRVRMSAWYGFVCA